MKSKLIAESLSEFRRTNIISEDELNELDLKSIGKDIKNFMTGQTGGKDVLFNFFKSIEGKDDVDDNIVNTAFDKVYAYSYNKTPKIKELVKPLNAEQKYQLMLKSKQTIDKNQKLNCPILVIMGGNQLGAGAVSTTAAPVQAATT